MMLDIDVGRKVMSRRQILLIKAKDERSLDYFLSFANSLLELYPRMRGQKIDYSYLPSSPLAEFNEEIFERELDCFEKVPVLHSMKIDSDYSSTLYNDKFFVDLRMRQFYLSQSSDSELSDMCLCNSRVYRTIHESRKFTYVSGAAFNYFLSGRIADLGSPFAQDILHINDSFKYHVALDAHLDGSRTRFVRGSLGAKVLEESFDCSSNDIISVIDEDFLAV